MAQRALVCGSIAVAASFFIVSGLAAAAPVAVTTAPTETVIPAAPRDAARQDTVVFAGPGGFLHQQEGESGYTWTPYAGGAGTPVTTNVPSAGQPGVAGAGADVVTTYSSAGIVLEDMDAGTSTTFQPADGERYVGTFGSRLLMEVPGTGGVVTALHVVGMSGGQQTDTTVTGWPADAVPTGTALAGDANDVVVSYTEATDTAGVRLALVDLASGQLTPLLDYGVQADATVLLTSKYIAWYSLSQDMYVVHVLERSDPTGTETKVGVRAQGGVAAYGIVGDTLLTAYRTTTGELGGPLTTAPLTNGAAQTTLLAHVDAKSLRSGGDSALVVGGSSVNDWAARQVTVGTDGTAQVTAVDSDPAVPSPVDGLAMAAGTLYTVERNSSPTENVVTRPVTLGGAAPGYGERTSFAKPLVSSDCDTAAGCAPPIATGLGEISQLGSGSGGDLVTVQQGSTDYGKSMGATGGSLVDADGQYFVYDGGSTDQQYIVQTVNDASTVLFTRPVTGAALSGSTLWTANSTAGSISSTDLTTRKITQTVNTGASCVPTELQAAGRWLYWTCGTSGPAGVYDLSTGADVTVPSGPAELGDGYVVEHDVPRGELTLTDVHTGTAVTSDLAALAAGPLGDDRRVTWAVDRFGGGIAYVDAQDDIHLVDPHIPATPITVTSASPAETYNGRWNHSWTLSQQVASATLTVTDRAGAVISTNQATSSGLWVNAGWGGTSSSGGREPNGVYGYKVAVTAADGSQTSITGSIDLIGSAPAFRDFDTVGNGNLITLTSTGWLTEHGADDGTLSTEYSSGGWPKGTTAFLVGTSLTLKCDDVMVRQPDGDLRLYAPSCGHWPTPSSASRLMATGFNQYKYLAALGNLHLDGTADLVAWSATGDNLYLIPVTADGHLRARVLVRSDLTYSRIISVGDLNGDGNGDLLAYDHSGNLWFMPGNGQGGFGARTPVFSDWGSGYNAMIGAGDLNRDGIPDLVERDSSGTLWFSPGRTNGTFDARVKLATGWNYTSTF